MVIYGGKDFWKRCALSLEWKRVVVMARVVIMEQVGLGEWNEIELAKT